MAHPRSDLTEKGVIVGPADSWEYQLSFIHQIDQTCTWYQMLGSTLGPRDW